MRTSFPRALGTATLFLSSCLFLSPAHASSVVVKALQGKAIQVRQPDGTKIEKLVTADVVVPGDTVVYRYIVNNNGTAPAEAVVVNTVVDPNMRYVDGSATPYGVEFSTDGGKVFAAMGDLRVPDVDGTDREAIPGDVTNIRWRLKHPVSPDRPFAVGFRAVLK